MNCRFCNAELEDGSVLCPACGQDNSDEQVVPAEEISEAAEQEVLEETAAETTENEAVEEEIAEQQPAKKKLKLWQLIGLVAAGVAVLAAIVCGIIFWEDIRPRANDIMYRDSYTVSDEKALSSASKVVATIGKQELTNGELQVYYWTQVMDYLQYNYVMGAYIDPTTLDKQIYDQATGKTLQKYFIEVAIQTWQNYAVLSIMAEENNMDMTGLKFLETMPEQIAALAKEKGLESADAVVQQDTGPGCDLDGYMRYLNTYYTGLEYFKLNYATMEPSEEELSQYFEKNKDAFAKNGITKESGMQADVRHILVTPEGGTKNEETGKTEYTDEAWTACLKEAEKILQEWKDGEATEASFAQLVSTYTDDTGSSTTGGLYQEVTPTSSYVKEFLEWAVDPARKVGETGIVKTEFGYHIMFYSYGEQMWILAAKTNMVAETASKEMADVAERYPMKVDYKKIVIGKRNFS